MKNTTKFSCLALLATSLVTTGFTGCGSNEGSTVIKPEMTAEDIQAKADAKMEASNEADAT